MTTLKFAIIGYGITNYRDSIESCCYDGDGILWS